MPSNPSPLSQRPTKTNRPIKKPARPPLVWSKHAIYIVLIYDDNTIRAEAVRSGFSTTRVWKLDKKTYVYVHPENIITDDDGEGSNQKERERETIT